MAKEKRDDEQEKGEFIVYPGESKEIPEGTENVTLVSTDFAELEHINLPNSVKSFTIEGINTKSSMNFSSKSTPTAQEVDWSNLHLPAGLKKFKIGSYTAATSLEGLRFPDDMDTLDLSSSAVTFLDGRALPKGLQHLDLSGSRITSFDRAQAREALDAVDLTASANITIAHSPITELHAGAELDLSECSNLRILNLSGNNLRSFQGIRMPESVRDLDISCNSASLLDLIPRGLEVLRANGTPLTALPSNLEVIESLLELHIASTRLNPQILRSLELFENLEALDCSKNPGIQSLEKAHFPKSLKKLTANRCGITSLKHLQELEGLEVLSLSGNQITTVTETRLPDSVEVLDLSGNPITSVNGFPCPRSLQRLTLINTELETHPSSLPSSVTVISDHDTTAPATPVMPKKISSSFNAPTMNGPAAEPDSPVLPTPTQNGQAAEEEFVTTSDLLPYRTTDETSDNGSLMGDYDSDTESGF